MDLYNSDLGTLLCLCIKAMFRQAAQSFWSDHPYQTAKSVFCQKKNKASHSTCNMYARGRVLNYKHGGGPKRQQWDLDK